MRAVELFTAINIALKMMNDHLQDPEKRIFELECQMMVDMEDSCFTIDKPEPCQNEAE